MKELAEFLKSEREGRRLSLEFVSEQSGISTNMLLALESADFERFAASLLIRNTIRSYCGVLEIDPDPLLEKFSSEIESYNIQDQGIKRYGEKMKILYKKRRMISFPLMVLLLSSAALFYAGTWISERRSRMYAPPPVDRMFSQEDLPPELQQKLGPAPHKGPGELPGELAGRASPPTRIARGELSPRDADTAIQKAENHIKEAEQSKAEKPPEEATPVEAVKAQPPETDTRETSGPASQLALSNSTEAVADDRPALAPEAIQKYRFAVEADDRVWIQVKIDNKVTRSAMLHSGDRREWTADSTMQVVVGNAGGIHMKWNDQPLKAPREQGRVLRFRLPDFAEEAE